MSPRLPSLTAKDVIRLVEGQGFNKSGQRGSHAKFIHPDGRTTIVPVHTGETIGPGLLLKILSDIGLDPKELRK